MKNHPIVKILSKSLIKLPTPASISYMWNWGSIIGLTISTQLITGVLLASHYNPNISTAFNSVIHTSRDVDMGYGLRFIHMNTASFFFILIFIHIRRNILNSSFKYNYTWASGVVIILILIGTAFLGYVLPWGQISFWGATVITNLLSALPYIGTTAVQWLWGGFSIGNATLGRFFTLHFLFPLILVFIIVVHLASLHTTGSNKPMGFNPNPDKIPFHPFFSLKDLLTVVILFLFILLISIALPFIIGDPENFNLANPINTPIHIQPEWYFLFAYAILRSIPNKLGGVLALLISILSLLFLILIKKKQNLKKIITLIKKIFLGLQSSFLNPYLNRYETSRAPLRTNRQSF